MRALTMWKYETSTRRRAIGIARLAADLMAVGIASGLAAGEAVIERGSGSAARWCAPRALLTAIADLAERGGLDRRDLEVLAAADACAL